MSTVKLSFLFLLSINILFISCKGKEKKEQSVSYTERYINTTFLENIKGKLPGSVPVYCYELYFINSDSVRINGGFETWTIPFKKEKENTYKLLKASRYGDMTLYINDDGTITLVDTAWTKNTISSVFKPVEAISSQEFVFDYHFNQQTIAGTYILFKKNQKTKQEITFNPDGTVKGFDNFLSYTLCFSGDCVGSTNPLSNLIELRTKDKSIFYAFSMDEENKKLSFFNLGDPIKNEKGGITIQDIAFDLRK